MGRGLADPSIGRGARAHYPMKQRSIRSGTLLAVPETPILGTENRRFRALVAVYATVILKRSPKSPRAARPCPC